jgi:hypothetical protein
MSKDLFFLASRQQYRFPSSRGELTCEQLWEVPLLSLNEFCLNSIAISLNSELKLLEEPSFVAPAVNPRRDQVFNMLEIVKIVIEVKQKESQERSEKARRTQEIQQIRELIEHKQTEELANSSVEELQAMLSELQ